MSDRDQLAALLADLFPAAERARWPFTVDLAADRLIAAGVTFTPAPALNVELLKKAAYLSGMPRDVTIADIEDLAAKYDRLASEPRPEEERS